MTKPRKKLGRPALPEGKKRVVLCQQYVTPVTHAKLHQVRANHGGIGRALDYAVMMAFPP